MDKTDVSGEGNQLPAEVNVAKGVWFYGGVCPNCGADNPAQNRYCGQCAAALDGAMKFCGQCDTYCNSDSNYCSCCGNKLDDEILSYKSGRIAGNGQEFFVAVLSFVFPGYGLLKKGHRSAALVLFIVAALAGLWQGLGIYLVFGALSMIAALFDSGW